MTTTGTDPTAGPAPARATRPTVNSDVGEAFGLHTFGNDEPLLRIVDEVNVACGFHSGDPDTMMRTVDAAVAAGVAVGAHPGLPDPVGFGRRAMAVTASEVEAMVTYQVGALVGFLDRAGGTLHHVKPHGALYGMLARDEELMAAAARVAAAFGVGVLGLAGTAHERVAADLGVPFTAELYVDLDYAGDGSLVILRRPPATDPRAAADRVRTALRTGSVTALDGTVLPSSFGSVCVHSDTPNAVEVARAVAAAIAEAHDGPTTPGPTPAGPTPGAGTP